MLKRMNIGPRLILAFTGILLLFLATSGLAIAQMSRMAGRVEQIVRGFNHEDDLVSDMGDRFKAIQTDLRLIALSGDPKAVAEQAAAIAKERDGLAKSAEELAPLVQAGHAKDLFAKVNETTPAALAGSAETLALLKAGKKEEAIATMAEAKNADAFLDSVDGYSQFMKSEMNRTYDEAQAGYRSSRMTILVILALALAGGALSAFFITRSIVRPIRAFMMALATAAGGDLTVAAPVDSQDEVGSLGTALNKMLENLRRTLREVARAATDVASGSTELASSSDQMSATTGEIARGSEAINSVTTQMASAINQLAASVHQVAANVQSSVGQSAQVEDAARQGGQGGADAVARMAKINEATTNIARVISLIQDIARQTNLLSLNAAIEAAKAGAQGKGFAVVAEEVRKLSERSREAAKEIEGLIQDTRLAVEGGTHAVESTLKLIGQIQEAIGSLTGLTREVGAATEEQATTAREVATHVDQAAHQVGQNAAATHELAATVQEISRTAGELARVSEGLAQAVAVFRV